MDGDWRIILSGGSCEPQAFVDDAPAEPWSFATTPAADATDIALTVGRCTIDPQLITPHVTYGPDAVVITTTVAEADGDRDLGASSLPPRSRSRSPRAWPGRPVYDGATIPPTLRSSG